LKCYVKLITKKQFVFNNVSVYYAFGFVVSFEI